jgi:hypothetical protein
VGRKYASSASIRNKFTKKPKTCGGRNLTNTTHQEKAQVPHAQLKLELCKTKNSNRELKDIELTTRYDISESTI